MYTSREYADKACEANELKQLLYIRIGEDGDETLEIAPVNYYVCIPNTNRTYGEINENYHQDLINEKKKELQSNNLSAAKAALENGYVTYKGVRIETNTATCNDLVYAKETLAFGLITEIDWLSKDDEHIIINAEDIIQIGSLIVGYRNAIWQSKYDVYKNQIDNATTLEELENIKIDYSTLLK